MDFTALDLWRECLLVQKLRKKSYHDIIFRTETIWPCSGLGYHMEICYEIHFELKDLDLRLLRDGLSDNMDFWTDGIWTTDFWAVDSRTKDFRKIAPQAIYPWSINPEPIQQRWEAYALIKNKFVLRSRNFNNTSLRDRLGSLSRRSKY